MSNISSTFCISTNQSKATNQTGRKTVPFINYVFSFILQIHVFKILVAKWMKSKQKLSYLDMFVI